MWRKIEFPPFATHHFLDVGDIFKCTKPFWSFSDKKNSAHRMPTVAADSNVKTKQNNRR